MFSHFLHPICSFYGPKQQQQQTATKRSSAKRVHRCNQHCGTLLIVYSSAKGNSSIHPSSHTDHHRHRLRLSFVSKNIYTPHFHLHTRITMTTTTSPGSILTTIGTLLILHSTYSCLHYRSLAMAADLPLSITSSPPLDVVVEVLVGFGMCLVGQLMMCGPFHEVRIASSKNDGGKRREIVPPAYRSRDFDLFTTRAKLLSVAIGQGAQ